LLANLLTCLLLVIGSIAPPIVKMREQLDSLSKIIRTKKFASEAELDELDGIVREDNKIKLRALLANWVDAAETRVPPITDRQAPPSWSLLHWAAYHGAMRCIDALLDLSASINAQQPEGYGIGSRLRLSHSVAQSVVVRSNCLPDTHYVHCATDKHRITCVFCAWMAPPRVSVVNCSCVWQCSWLVVPITDWPTRRVTNQRFPMRRFNS
jgi:hypothetical protein